MAGRADDTKELTTAGFLFIMDPIETIEAILVEALELKRLRQFRDKYRQG
jgi:hypothetical protein